MNTAMNPQDALLAMLPEHLLLGGIVLLDEPLTWRLALASIAILGGIALVILHKPAT